MRLKKIRSHLRTRHPQIFKRLVAIRYSQLALQAAGLWRRRGIKKVLQASPPLFPVRFEARCGFGGLLSQTIAYLEFCDRESLRPVIQYLNPLYVEAPGVDLFGGLFNCTTAEGIDQSTLLFHPIFTHRDYTSVRLENTLSLERANKLFEKYIKIQPRYVEEADNFAKKHFEGRVLGVHFRGTDKFLESGMTSQEQFLEAVASEIRSNPDITTVFIGTDEPSFLVAFRQRFNSLKIATYLLGPPLDGALPRHLSNFPGPLLAREALVTILLFARCYCCIRTCSHLSGWARIINPSLATITLNEVVAQALNFPDRQIVRTETLTRAQAGDLDQKF